MRMPNKREAAESLLNERISKLLKPFRDRTAAANTALGESHCTINPSGDEAVLVVRHPIYKYQYVQVKSRAVAAKLPKLAAEYEAAHKAENNERARLEAAARPVLAQIALTQDYERIAAMLATIK